MWRYDPKRLPSYYQQNTLEWVDFRKQPSLYKVGKWEQWVLMVEPYKSEILPHRRFKNEDIAKDSSQKLYAQFLWYIAQEDFVWADMTRKFIQMWFTRARRYANHKSWKKYAKNPQDESTKEKEMKARKKYLLPLDPDPEKARAAAVFKKIWDKAEKNPRYANAKTNRKKKYG